MTWSAEGQSRASGIIAMNQNKIIKRMEFEEAIFQAAAAQSGDIHIYSMIIMHDVSADNANNVRDK